MKVTLFFALTCATLWTASAGEAVVTVGLLMAWVEALLW